MIDIRNELGQTTGTMYDLQWYAIKTKPNCECLVTDGLTGKGYENLTPFYRQRKQLSDRIKEVKVPLFRGYVFSRFCGNHRVPILSTPGVFGIVNFGKELAVVQDNEIEALRKVMASGLCSKPWPFLKVGLKVSVEGGPLRGTEGVIVRENKGVRFIVSVTLLQRSVAVEIQPEWIRVID